MHIGRLELNIMYKNVLKQSNIVLIYMSSELQKHNGTVHRELRQMTLEYNKVTIHQQSCTEDFFCGITFGFYKTSLMPRPIK
jgi:hypothetical protein